MSACQKSVCLEKVSEAIFSRLGESCVKCEQLRLGLVIRVAYAMAVIRRLHWLLRGVADAGKCALWTLAPRWRACGRTPSAAPFQTVGCFPLSRPLEWARVLPAAHDLGTSRCRVGGRQPPHLVPTADAASTRTTLRRLGPCGGDDPSRRMVASVKLVESVQPAYVRCDR